MLRFRNLSTSKLSFFFVHFIYVNLDIQMNVQYFKFIPIFVSFFFLTFLNLAFYENIIACLTFR